jgi:L-alanine-DL-glutamate epimerase-like enolase superfamily enzyme
VSPLPIAAGENHYGKWEFKELIGRGALAFGMRQPRAALR